MRAHTDTHTKPRRVAVVSKIILQAITTLGYQLEVTSLIDVPVGIFQLVDLFNSWKIIKSLTF